MPIENSTTYSTNSVIVSATTARSQDLNALNTAFANAFQTSFAGKKIDNTNSNSNGIIATTQNNSATNVGTNIAVDALLREMETIKQSENATGKNTHNKRNDNKNTESTRLDNKQLDKTSLNQSELRNSEIKTDYINQLDRRAQIRDEYLNRLNKRDEQNKNTIITDSSKELPKINKQPQQPLTNSILNQTQTITPNKNNIAGNNNIQFLNVSNHRAVVRELLRQDMAGVDQTSSPDISVTIINSSANTLNESIRQTTNTQQTTFTIFTPNGRLDPLEYEGEQNNNQQQNNENDTNDEHDENDENKKEKKKNNIVTEQLESDKSPNNNSHTTEIEPDILNNHHQTKKPINETNEILDNDTIDIRVGDKEDFDVSRLPEFIVTILSEPAKFAGQNGFAKNTQDNNNDTTNDDTNDIVDENIDSELLDISRQRRLLLRIAAACRSMANQNNTFRIKLNLDNNGELFIRITKNKGKYSVSFTATKSDVAENLNNGLNSLIESLSNDNIKLDNVTINIGQI
ncbi:MAG: flagellar hook-length control protein FliK [Planctomycetaceae bacterium]|jgi:hypothetical protein|nr:flagellar hook-length control protein FliK [Planctomycetaceae bacterium]